MAGRGRRVFDAPAVLLPQQVEDALGFLRRELPVDAGERLFEQALNLLARKLRGLLGGFLRAGRTRLLFARVAGRAVGRVGLRAAGLAPAGRRRDLERGRCRRGRRGEPPRRHLEVVLRVFVR